MNRHDPVEDEHEARLMPLVAEKILRCESARPTAEQFEGMERPLGDSPGTAGSAALVQSIKPGRHQAHDCIEAQYCDPDHW